MKTALLILPMLIILSMALPGARAVVVGVNVEVRGEDGTDKEVRNPSIAVDPRSPNIIVAGAQDSRLVPPDGCFNANGCHLWDAYYRSTDGGLTWSSRLVPGFHGDTSPLGSTSPLQHYTGSGHPELAFDRSGNLYYSGIASNHTNTGWPFWREFRVFVAKFSNDGADYVGAVVLSAGPNRAASLPRLAVDTTGGPDDGNVYLTFIHACTGDCGYSAYFTRSTNGGLSFSKPIPFPGSGWPTGATPMTIDSAGNIFVARMHCTQGNLCLSEQGATILVVKSNDGGLTFDKPVVAASMTTYPVPLPSNSFTPIIGSAASMAADANGIYIVWDDYRTGDVNILLTRSTDGGHTWSNPLRVNDVSKGQQFFPTIATSGGIVSVAWYDSRLGQLPNGTITGLDVFYAESRDAGRSFSQSVRVTSTSFDPTLVHSRSGSPAIGEQISLAATPNIVHVIWTDNRNACDTIDPTFGCTDQDIYTATIGP